MNALKTKGVNLLITISVTILIFGIINLGLFGIQKLWHYDDQMKLEAMKTELDMLKIEIENQETDLLSLQNNSDQQATEDELYTLYKTNIDTYNQKVNEANDLAKEIGSTWILVPIPGKR